MFLQAEITEHEAVGALGTPGALEIPAGERGSALIMTMVIIMMISTLVLVTSQMTLQRSEISVQSTQYLQLTADAESGIGAKFEAIAESESELLTVIAPLDLTLGANTVAVRVVGVSSDVYRVTSTSTNPAGRSVEIVTTITAAIDPAFRKALYVGNKDGLPVPVRLGPVDNLTSDFTYDESQFRSNTYRISESDIGIDFNNDGDETDDPEMQNLDSSSYPDWGVAQGNMEQSGSTYRIDLDQDGTYGTYTKTTTLAPEFSAPTGTELTDPNWATDHQGDGDYVEGDVHVNGDAELRGNTLAFGDVEATGTVQGQNRDSTATGGAASIEPPDLHAIDYESIADTVVTTSDLSHPAFNGPLSGSDYGLLGDATGMDNGVVHLGPNSSGGTANFSSSDNGDLIFVEGNLWMHSTSNKKISLPSESGLVMTIVVEGNLYIADDFQYNDANGDAAVLFLVKGKTDDPNTPEREDESYHDANKNLTYDVGETIINDDGNGTYEGPKEGQGNVFFGDVKYGTGGVTDGYMYAENNAYLMDPSAATDPLSSFNEDDKIYGVYGFLSAGGVVDLGDRALGDDTYFQYKVKEDPRLKEQTITFKGLPGASGGGSAFTLLSWTTRRF